MEKTKNEIFIEKAKKVHGNKYVYSKIEYINAHTKVCIICPSHGEFWQTPNDHLNGKGCIRCGNISSTKKRKTKIEEFIKKSNIVHNNKYIYTSIDYINNKTNICIICPEHGEFWQRPDHHLMGCGCPKCGVNNTKTKNSSDTKDFIEKAKKVHKNKYDYSKVEYVNNHTKICIVCPEHGEFWQSPDKHLEMKGCPKCGHKISKPEDEIIKIIQRVNPQQRNRGLVENKEIDIYVPSIKLGIEYNGLRWHSEIFGKDRSYHINKLNECNKQGIKLVQIFEDEWINHREICESKLKQICGLNSKPKIFARKCELHKINDKNEAYEFLDKNHIQGRTGFTIAIGAYFNRNLVGVMTFKREKEGYWDLNRFATDINHLCIGVGGKLFKYFTEHYDFKEVKSFADRRWTTNPTDNLYIKLGFELDSYIEPTYWYYNQKNNPYKRFHKFGFRKQHLHKQYGLPLTMTEREMTESLGYTRIWDCGLIKYIFKNNLTT